MAIKLNDVNYTYDAQTAMSVHALDHVSLEIKDGEFVAIMGHTGSGKSTLIQMLNGLIRPTSGEIYYNDENILADGYSMTALRGKVGLVFQYPEHQLFESDVLKDVMFGPKNLGYTKAEAKKQAIEALLSVGIAESQFELSPFELSGGQKRRVAIAGVLAMSPQVLVLDEPTAGLDPYGRDQILELLAKLHKEKNITIILVSHSMDDVADYCERVIVLSKGKVVFDDKAKEVFKHVDELEQIGLAAPQVSYIIRKLNEKGFELPDDIIMLEEAKAAILAKLRKNQ